MYYFSVFKENLLTSQRKLQNNQNPFAYPRERERAISTFAPGVLEQFRIKFSINEIVIDCKHMGFVPIIINIPFVVDKKQNPWDFLTSQTGPRKSEPKSQNQKANTEIVGEGIYKGLNQNINSKV